MKTSDPIFTERPDAALDRLLSDAAFELSEDFVSRVSAQLPPRATPVRPTRRPTKAAWHWLRMLALLVGSLLGLSQVLAFVLGVWLASAAV